MPLDDTHLVSVSEAVTFAFAEIGKDHLPATRSTKEKLALEYWVSSVLLRLAEARRDKAKRAAVHGNVLPDTLANPFPIGTAEAVYAGALVTIGLKVVPQAERLNVAGLTAYLEKNGVRPALLKRAVKRNTETFAGAHIYTALLTV
jgi:hypothetical protein